MSYRELRLNVRIVCVDEEHVTRPDAPTLRIHRVMNRRPDLEALHHGSLPQALDGQSSMVYYGAIESSKTKKEHTMTTSPTITLVLEASSGPRTTRTFNAYTPDEISSEEIADVCLAWANELIAQGIPASTVVWVNPLVDNMLGELLCIVDVINEFVSTADESEG